MAEGYIWFEFGFETPALKTPGGGSSPRAEIILSSYQLRYVASTPSEFTFSRIMPVVCQ
jgi:hypothetical protein